MCNGRPRSSRDRLFPRPRWIALYGILVLGASSAVGVEVFGPAGVVRTALRWAVVIGGSVGIALWRRLNRVPLDAEDWCACAGETMTVRVIGSPMPVVHAPVPATAGPRRFGSTLAEEETDAVVLTRP